MELFVTSPVFTYIDNKTFGFSELRIFSESLSRPFLPFHFLKTFSTRCKNGIKFRRTNEI